MSLGVAHLVGYCAYVPGDEACVILSGWRCLKSLSRITPHPTG